MNFYRPVSLFLLCAAIIPWAAQAKDPVASFGKKRNNHIPIEVTSDALEVLQEENRAIFTGNVVVIQGEVRLKADKMTVHYAKGGAKGNTSETGKARRGAAKAQGENAIRKIDAEGGVFLTTIEETASGRSGTYDVENQEIRLTGDVVLTRGKNVLQGEKLTYNFETGKSKIVSASADAKEGSGGGGKRVRALFVPENDEKK
jgi:lipopolysaccharide export system protein LptA